MKLLALVAVLAAAANAETLRVIKGQVSDLTETKLTIRDSLLRPNNCELPTAAERLPISGNATAPALANGSYVEAIVVMEGMNCSVRTLYIRPLRAPILSTSRSTSFLDNLFPRGNLVFTGTVQSLSEKSLELRSRRGLHTVFSIRDDTAFSTGGRLVKRDDLAPQTVVQVRAGKTFSGELEVYQVTWGDILPGH